MKKKLIMAAMPYCKRECLCTLLLEDDVPAEVYIRPLAYTFIKGNIYLGKVESIHKQMQACFVRFTKDMVGFLPLSDSQTAIYKTKKKDLTLKVGDELLVQVDKEAVKEKQPRLTTNLTLTGQYLVLSSGIKSWNCSKKLSKEEKKKVMSFLSFSKDAPFGVIIRTQAKDALADDLKREFDYLSHLMERIINYGTARPCHTEIYSTPGDWSDLVKSHSLELEGVITDIKSLYVEMKESDLFFQKTNQEKLHLYEDSLLPLYKLFSMESILEKCMQKKVWLKSGGFLMIEQTEALVVVDVNTGKNIEKKSAQETFFKINTEAAQEIAYQIRLRGLTGIILVDFINMEDSDRIKELEEILSKILFKDPVRTRFVDFTKLQLAELTRQKGKKSLAEQIVLIKEQ